MPPKANSYKPAEAVAAVAAVVAVAWAAARSVVVAVAETESEAWIVAGVDSSNVDIVGPGTVRVTAQFAVVGAAAVAAVAIAAAVAVGVAVAVAVVAAAASVDAWEACCVNLLPWNSAYWICL